ncbi:MAG: TRAP transporter small permease subunit [Deltaproteobacteria bacterium]|nr:TRAP transporter small permease subunit [Deltaproteobacteria bacterium]
MKRTLKFIKRVYNRCINGLVYIGAGLILFMVLIISASVFLRTTKYSFSWGLEASEYILIITTFFAAGWLLKTGGHIGVDIIPNFIKGRPQDLYNGVIYSIVAIVCLVFTMVGAFTAWDAYVAGTLQVRMYTFPKWILISLIPIGGFFLFVESVKLAHINFRGKLILIVDDEVDILDTLKEFLKNYKVHEAQNFATASDKLENNVYDVVILDIMGVKGLDLLKMSIEKDLPAIMLTSHAFNMDTFKKSMKTGAVSFMPKAEIENIDLYVKDALTMSKEDARLSFYRRLGSFLDYRFGPGWDKHDGFSTEAHKE